MFQKLKLHELASQKVLDIRLCDQSGQSIGGLRLGPNPGRAGGKRKERTDSIGEEVGHWESVMAHPGEWQEVWHTLRTTTDPK